MDADGTGLRRLTTAAGNDANPAFSPKGDLIAFESNRDGMPEIYVTKADGTGIQERLTNFTAEPTPRSAAVSKPTWSPAGDRIAFHRRVGAQGALGHLEIYTMNADGTNVSQITFTPVARLQRLSELGQVVGKPYPVVAITADCVGGVMKKLGLVPIVLGVFAFAGCSNATPVAPASAPGAASELSAKPSTGTPGVYSLTFMATMNGTLQEVTSLPVLSAELILKASVTSSTGTTAQAGTVTFEYCSDKGRPSNDISRADEAPKEACDQGTATWARLRSILTPPPCVRAPIPDLRAWASASSAFPVTSASASATRPRGAASKAERVPRKTSPGRPDHEEVRTTSSLVRAAADAPRRHRATGSQPADRK